MSTEEHRAIIRRFAEDCWNAGHLEVVDEVLADPVMRNGERVSRAWMKAFIGMIRTALPDERTAIDDLIAEGDRVAWGYTSRGTHQGGPLFGVPPTGKEVTVTGIALLRLAEGRIEAIWDSADRLALYQQLSLIPTGG